MRRQQLIVRVCETPQKEKTRRNQVERSLFKHNSILPPTERNVSQHTQKKDPLLATAVCNRKQPSPVHTQHIHIDKRRVGHICKRNSI